MFSKNDPFNMHVHTNSRKNISTTKKKLTNLSPTTIVLGAYYVCLLIRVSCTEICYVCYLSCWIKVSPLSPFFGRVTEVFKPIVVEHNSATYDVVHLSSEEQLVTMTGCV